MAELSTAELNNLPDSAFAYVEPGGTKDADGKTVPRSLRHFAIHDATHVRNALARLSGSPFEAKARPAVEAAAKRMGIGQPAAMASRAADLDSWPSRITRAIALEDMAIRPGRITCETCGRDATGRVVDAYAGVFLQEATIVDDDGTLYLEDIDPGAWNKRLSDISRARSGLRSVQVFYNHGKTLEGTPSESASHPLGHPMAIRADHYGLLTSTHYGTTDIADRVFTDIKDGNITGHSFTGGIFRSDPPRKPRAVRGGALNKVRRLELGLDEYGPSPLAYYEGAGLVAVRGGVQADPADPVAPADPEVSQAGIVAEIQKARLLGRV